jgi:hypothetical protein
MKAITILSIFVIRKSELASTKNMTAPETKHSAYFTLGFLKSGTIDISGQITFVVGGCCVVGCLASSLASTVLMPVAYLTFHTPSQPTECL